MTAVVPMLVLDHGHSPNPHQARCRLCRWRGGWHPTVDAARTDHTRHLATAHARGGEAA
jgi:hypothetical protein